MFVARAISAALRDTTTVADGATRSSDSDKNPMTNNPRRQENRARLLGAQPHAGNGSLRGILASG